MFEDFAKFVSENYPNTSKIVEVGVGHRINVAADLKKRLPNTELIVTDKDESWIRAHRTRNIRMVVDDAASPILAVYEGAGLIYSLHPPMELVESLVAISRKVGADLFVLPVMDEQEALLEGGWKKVTRLGRTLGWLLQSQRRRNS